MTKFLHTADLHLNAQRRMFPQTYLKRAKWVLRAIEEAAVEYECECIVIAGDVYEQANLTNAERYLFSEWLGHVQVPVIAISGNHDARSQRIGDTCLHDIASLPLRNHIINDGDPSIVVAHGCTWVLIPFHPWTQIEYDLIVEAYVHEAIDVAPKQHVIVVSHVAVTGCITDNEHQLADRVTTKLKTDLPVTYWALGDIHLMQSMAANAFYPGSPYQVDFGEKRSKSVLLVDTATPTEPLFLELECPYPLVTVKQYSGEKWSEFSRYTGDADIDLPAHVVRAAPAQEEVVIDTSALQSRVPPLHGLEERLVQQGLNSKLIPRTLEMANTMFEQYAVREA